MGVRRAHYKPEHHTAPVVRAEEGVLRPAAFHRLQLLTCVSTWVSKGVPGGCACVLKG